MYKVFKFRVWAGAKGHKRSGDKGRGGDAAPFTERHCRNEVLSRCKEYRCRFLNQSHR